jgi:2-hydroxy-6-oxonona-2,4-dienedioate hydrolase/2-hydroxy-6-oxo-6-(2'-carboxyphenyl)-hexa-2,4-dienoate hydrolase
MSFWTDTLGAEVRFRQAGPWRTRSLEAGEGDEHVILLSGISGHLEGWTRNVCALAAQGLNVHAIDAVGHGFTDKPLGVDYVAPLFAKHIVAFLDALGIEKAHLVGQSLGGWNALYTAKTYPDRVGKLVHVTGAGILLDDQARAEESKEVGNRVQAVTQRALAAPTLDSVRERLEWLMYDPATVTDELVESRYRIYTLPDSRVAMPKLVEQAPGEANRPYLLTEADLAAIPHETLVLWSDHNPTTPMEVGRRAAEIMPNARFALVTEAGHWPMFEQPEQFNTIVGQFLTGTAESVARA